VVRDRRVRALHVACGNFEGGLRARDALGRRGLGRRAAWTPRVADGQGAARAGAPARRRRDAARFQRNNFRLGYFEHVFLPIFELKCTKW
jgi:hypothetical protein